MENNVYLFCQKCGKKITKNQVNQTKINSGQQKGLVLQLCSHCVNIVNRPNFLNKAVYK